MPGITGLPQSNGPSSSRFDGDLTVSEIKERAKETVSRNSKGASPVSLINNAKSQIDHAQTLEEAGDLKGALLALSTAAWLSEAFINSTELKAEGAKGILYLAWRDFQEHGGEQLPSRLRNMEAKLKELEKSKSSSPNTSSGGSIEDRMRALRDSGMNTSTVKPSRSSKDPQTPPPKHSPRFQTKPMHHDSVISPPLSPSTSRDPPLPPIHAMTPTSPRHSIAHAFVPTSSFGPPSPMSSPASSPRSSQVNLSLNDVSAQFSLSSIPSSQLSKSPPPSSRDLDFAQFSRTFPSIDELEELDVLKLPSVPTTVPGAPKSKAIAGGSGSSERGGGLVNGSGRTFPTPSVNLGPRPSSTPITPTSNTFFSRVSTPESPEIISRPGPPHAEPAPIPSGSMLTLPKDTIIPKDLHNFLTGAPKYPRIQILLLDVRTREEFDREHIRVKGESSTATTTVCLEPSVLLRDSMTASSLEDSLHIGPIQERTLFMNRGKFDLVVVYDRSSRTLDAPPPPAPSGHLTFSPITSTSTSKKSALSVLVNMIYPNGGRETTNAFSKKLRNAPVLLVGGMEAWKRDVGDAGIAKSEGAGGASESRASARGAPSASTPVQPRPVLPSSPSLAFMSGVNGSSSPSSPAVGGYQYRAGFGIDSKVDHLPLRSMGVDGASVVNGSGHSPPAPIVSRSSSYVSSSFQYPRLQHDNASPSSISPTMIHASIQYPTVPRVPSASSVSASPTSFNAGAYDGVPFPPQASISPTISRRRNDFVDQSQQAVSGIAARSPVEHPLHQVIRPPPVAASPTLERQDNRPRLHGSRQMYPGPPKPPTIQSDYPVTYWPDIQIGTSGLKNLGNTCYMNATIQCLSATVPFARFFTDGRWKNAVNMMNPLGSKGGLAQGFASVLHELWHGDMPYLTPYSFRKTICIYASQFAGSDQHDSQEFLTFLLDGLHEDLNRVINKPLIEATPEREAELEKLPQQIASEQEWITYRTRNDSPVVDTFQGQFRNRMECLTCQKTSTTYNSFMYLTLPVPSGKGSTRVPLSKCLDNFLSEEVMEQAEAWYCPNCKALRSATKKLSLSRLPPVLLIHLKRFQVKGPFTDKIETSVDFPLKGLDLTNYMPPPLPPGADKRQLNGGLPISPDDARAQVPPYRYELYGVTNHVGSLSSGHYTAFVASRGGWMYCDDSSVKVVDAKEVVGRSAYVLFYKRIRQ